MAKAKRRDPRVEVQLAVRLQTAVGEQTHETKDISARGVFIVCDDPLPLRRLARFRTVLDDGAQLQMLGLVAHRINIADAADRGIAPGMGLQLYSLGEATHDQWRVYVDQCIEAIADEPSEAHDTPTVRIHLTDAKMLQRFVEVDLPTGEIFYRTPDPLHTNETLVCEIVHPETGKSFLYPGHVRSTVQDGGRRHRGMTVVFDDLDEEQQAEFAYFLEGQQSEVFE